MLKGVKKKKKAKHLHSNVEHKTLIWYIRDVTFKLSQKPRPDSWGCEDWAGHSYARWRDVPEVGESVCLMSDATFWEGCPKENTWRTLWPTILHPRIHPKENINYRERISAQKSSLQTFYNNEHSEKQHKFPCINTDNSQQHVEKKRQEWFMWPNPLWGCVIIFGVWENIPLKFTVVISAWVCFRWFLLSIFLFC